MPPKIFVFELSYHTYLLVKIIIRGPLNKFPFKIVVDSCEFSILLLYILWDDWSIFIISASNEQLQQQLEYTLLKPDCHSWWISKMQSGREDTLEERYAIKLCLKLGKIPQKRIECFRLLFDHLAWIEHQYLSGIRDSRKTGVGGVRKSEHQSWLAQRFRVRVTMLRFKGSSGRDSVGRGQHSSNRASGISTRTIHQSTTPSWSQTIWARWASRQFLSLSIVQTLLPVTFGYSLSS